MSIQRKTPPKSKRLTPKDKQRLGELAVKGALTPEERLEEESLFRRFTEWGEFRDMGGSAYIDDIDGQAYAPCTQRRLRRIARVRLWQQQRHKDRHENLKSAVDAEREKVIRARRKGGIKSGKKRIEQRGDCIENHRAEFERLRKTMTPNSAAQHIARKTGFNADAIAAHFRRSSTT